MACLPKVEPQGWLFCFTESHWQSVESTKLWLNKVCFPYFEALRKELNLPQKSYEEVLICTEMDLGLEFFVGMSGVRMFPKKSLPFVRKILYCAAL